MALFQDNLVAQNCAANKLLGEWIYVRSTAHYSTDSFKREYLETFLHDSIKDQEWSWRFDTTGKRTSFPKFRRQFLYRVDEKNCRILYGKRKNPPREKINQILYLDDKYLVLVIPNPHSYTNGYFRKK
jgi:hypothetical protein